ncbi:PREDICTED: C2 calcium-dependent domain-containing protein 4A [Condylura cristata]|uniref:C2 calcium-dependent domain-containing protein 4A n=1 Tax=Condylura cristata TaxID=143302 RepID=UPI0006439A31|nr:PREDICTED: C2 calcium-dependent domain-containing protein 4A [Condylura cristata]
MWFLERLRLDPERLLRGGNGLFQGRVSRTTAVTPTTCTNVLTPDRIPEFCIPPRLAPCSAPAALRDSWGEEVGAEDSSGTQAPLPATPLALALARLPPPAPRRPPLEAEGTVTLGRAGGALRLAAQYSPAGGRLRIRLLRAEGPAGGSAEPCAVGCRVSFVLQPPGKARQPRGAMVLRSRTAVLDQDFCLDGLSEDDVRRLAVRVKAEHKGHSPERGELHLGALLLP